MPGLIKIGWTNKNPYDRAKQLQSTGVPAPFKVYGYVTVENPQKIEHKIHVTLSKYRKYKSREFFRIKPQIALETLEKISGQYEQIRKNEAIEAEHLKREQIKREKQLEVEKQYMSVWESLCEVVEKHMNVRLFKKLEEYSSVLASFICCVGVLFYSFLEENDFLALFITVGLIILVIHLYLGRVADQRLKDLKQITCNGMEDHFGPSWHPYKEKCIDQLYEKYVRNIM